MSAICLTHGYFLSEDPQERAIMRPYPPLGILYLSAWLDLHGVDNQVFDTTFAQKEGLQSALLAQPPRILAFYVNLMTKRNVLHLMQWVRSRAALAQTRIVLGGPDVTHNAADYLSAGADVIVVGEGEQTMLELAQAPSFSPDALMRISGLVLRLPDGCLHHTAPREKMRDVDALPFPNRLKINMQAYLDAWKKAHGQSTVSLSTQRGCPYTCRWCSTAVYGQSYRRQSPARTLREILWLQQHYDFDLIWFVDDVFTISHKWLREFRDQLIENQTTIRYECITRADRMNNEVVALLRETGCFRVWIGAESGSQRILDAMDRRVEVTQVREMIQAVRLAGMEAGTFIMLGYPGETEADIRATLQHLKACNPDLFTITVAYPIKGTGLYEAVENELSAAAPWAERSDRDLDFARKYSRRYYHFAVRWMVNAMHWHKAKTAGNPWTIKALGYWAKATVAGVGMVVHRGGSYV